MKKSILLIVACVFAFATIQAQSSEVEATTQLTKAEQFKVSSSIVKEDKIYRYNGYGVELFVKLFTNLKTGEQLVALEIWPSTGQKLLGITAPLGYLDIEDVDDLILALESITENFNNSEKKQDFSITYTAPGGIDVFFEKEGAKSLCYLRKKWYSVDDYGIQTCNYSTGCAILHVTTLPQLISSIKEAQAIANQALAK